METQLFIVQVESARWTVHSPRQTQLGKKNTPSLQQKGGPTPSLHDARPLIGCMEILFLKLAATIFDLFTSPTN